MWILKFAFIFFGVVYELIHYIVTNIYSVITRKVSDLYKLHKSSA